MEYGVKIVSRLEFIGFFMPATQATVYQARLVTFRFYRDGRHKAAATGRAVARITINVLAPEAFRAVICVAGAVHLSTTVLTDEILINFFKHIVDKLTLYGTVKIVNHTLAVLRRSIMLDGNEGDDSDDLVIAAGRVSGKSFQAIFQEAAEKHFGKDTPEYNNAQWHWRYQRWSQRRMSPPDYVVKYCEKLLKIGGA